jgi:hypothetical protein
MLASGTGHIERLPIPELPGTIRRHHTRAAARARRPGRPLEGGGIPNLPRAGSGRQTGSSCRSRFVRRPRRRAAPGLGSDRRPASPSIGRGSASRVLDLPAPDSAHAKIRAKRRGGRGGKSSSPERPVATGEARRQDGVLEWDRLRGALRRTGRFSDMGARFDFPGETLASSFRPRLALSVATRSVVGGRVSTSTRAIS